MDEKEQSKGPSTHEALGAAFSYFYLQVSRCCAWHAILTQAQRTLAFSQRHSYLIELPFSCRMQKARRDSARNNGVAAV